MPCRCRFCYRSLTLVFSLDLVSNPFDVFQSTSSCQTDYMSHPLLSLAKDIILFPENHLTSMTRETSFVVEWSRPYHRNPHQGLQILVLQYRLDRWRDLSKSWMPSWIWLRRKRGEGGAGTISTAHLCFELEWLRRTTLSWLEFKPFAGMELDG